MSSWRQYLFGDVDLWRARLLSRGFLLIFALDVWANMLSRAGRYGVEGFNVAHFAWLDAVSPIPTPGFYIGTLSIAATAAFIAGLSGLRRWSVVIAAVAMNYAWAMSLIDSYQHHYLLGLLLVCMLGFIGEAEGEDRGKPPGRRVAWGFPLVCCVMGVVYLFAALSKLDTVWREGEVLRRIMGDRAAPFVELWASFGGAEPEFWIVAAHGVVAAEIFICAAYVLAPIADRGHRAARVVCGFGLVAAVSFHLSVEWVGLNIEWFSYYLFFLAVVCFSPAAVLAWPGRFIGRVAQAVSRRYSRWVVAEVPFASIGALTTILVIIVADAVDLPGVVVVGVAGAIGITVLVVRGARSPSTRARSGRLTASGAIAALTMLVTVDFSDARYDYYRFVGGDAFRRAQHYQVPTERRARLEQSLRAYRKANRYAPPDDDRLDKERQVRTLLELTPEHDGVAPKL